MAAFYAWLETRGPGVEKIGALHARPETFALTPSRESRYTVVAL